METATLKSVMQGMKDVDELRHLGCQCNNIPMGSYDASLWVESPFRKGCIVMIDICVLPEVVYLWNRGIETVESCCGHNQTHGYIAVPDQYINVMKDIGYIEFKPNCFYRRGNWWLNGTGMMSIYPFGMDIYFGTK